MTRIFELDTIDQNDVNNSIVFPVEDYAGVGTHRLTLSQLAQYLFAQAAQEGEGGPFWNFDIQIGKDAESDGNDCLSVGPYTFAQNTRASAVGYDCSADGNWGSNAFGYRCSATSSQTSAFGHWSEASGYAASAFGDDNTASGYASSALGSNNTASGYYCTACGYDNYAGGDECTAAGDDNYADGNNSSAIGSGNYASGNRNSAFGYDNEADGNWSCSAFGYRNDVNDSMASAFGHRNTTNGRGASAMGNYNTASGDYSTACGYNNTASGDYSTACGYECSSSGNYSSTFGSYSHANAIRSTAIGYNAQTRCADTVNIGGAIIVRGDEGWLNADQVARGFAGVQNIIMSKDIDFVGSPADITFSLPTGSTFYVDEVGIIVNGEVGNLSVQPTVRFGFDVTYAGIFDATITTNLTAAGKREKITELLSYDGYKTLTAGVTVSATADYLHGRFYWKGILVEDTPVAL